MGFEDNFDKYLNSNSHSQEIRVTFRVLSFRFTISLKNSLDLLINTD